MKRSFKVFFLIAYFAFIGISLIAGYLPGKAIAFNFASFSLDMLKVLPFAFILIGLFEVWVKRETIERHLGEKSGIRGYLWVILLSGFTVGGLYVAFPVALSLYKKGAKLEVIFTYLGASAVCRIPMTIFEASFVGLSFSIVRIFISLPLVIISSILLGCYLRSRGYRFIEK